MTLIFWVLTAIIYPLLILGVGIAFPNQANGSIMQNIDGQVIGSALIGQRFRSERYFQGRPSTIRYSQGEQAKPTGISGASNLAPSNPDLFKRIEEEVNNFKENDILASPDLVYTSASGLDPHISISSAREQLDRVARARNMEPDEMRRFIDKYTVGRFLGIFGEPGVNVLRLNYALDLKERNRE
jgi:K+-transporting ATPase ATPase C chain